MPTDRPPGTFMAGLRDGFAAVWTRTDLPFKMFLVGLLLGLIGHDLLVSLPLRLFGIYRGCP